MTPAKATTAIPQRRANKAMHQKAGWSLDAVDLEDGSMVVATMPYSLHLSRKLFWVPPLVMSTTRLPVCLASTISDFDMFSLAMATTVEVGQYSSAKALKNG